MLLKGKLALPNLPDLIFGMSVHDYWRLSSILVVTIGAGWVLSQGFALRSRATLVQLESGHVPM